MSALDYSLLIAVAGLTDGACVHTIAQELNAYRLATTALEEPGIEDPDRAEIAAMKETAEKNLRAFVTRQRLAKFSYGRFGADSRGSFSTPGERVGVPDNTRDPDRERGLGLRAQADSPDGAENPRERQPF